MKSSILRANWTIRIGALVSLFIISWVILTAGYAIHLRKNRGFNEAAFSDAVLPWRWDTLRRKRGEFYLREADRALEKREINPALRFLRSGLALAPANRGGRLRLAALYHALNRAELATETLLAGLRAGPADPALAIATLQYLLAIRDYPTVEKEGAEFLRAQTLPPPDKIAVALLTARAAFELGHYESMLAHLATPGAGATPDAIWLRARTHFETGYPVLARAELAAASAAGPIHPSLIELMAEDCRARDDTAREKQLLVQALAADPLAHQPRLAFLRHLSAAREDERLREETKKYLTHFGADETALLALADFAASLGLPALATTALQAARLRPSVAEMPFQLLEAEAQLRARDFPGCLRLLDEIGRTLPPESTYTPVVHGLRAAAGFGQRDFAAARAQIDLLLALKGAGAPHFVSIAEQLEALGQIPEARRLLAAAHRADDRNQKALANLLRLEMEAGLSADFPRLVRAYLALAKPAPALLVRLRTCLAGDNYLLLPGQTQLLASLERATASR